MTKESSDAVLCFEIGIETPKKVQWIGKPKQLINPFFFATRTLVHARIHKYRILLLSDFFVLLLSSENTTPVEDESISKLTVVDKLLDTLQKAKENKACSWLFWVSVLILIWRVC